MGAIESEATMTALSEPVEDHLLLWILLAAGVGLLVAAGLPAVATLPAVVFGVVELTTSAGLVRWFEATST